MRKLLIAANWKMYKTPADSTAFLTNFFPLVKQNTKAEDCSLPRDDLSARPGRRREI